MLYNVATDARSTKGFKHSDETKLALKLFRIGKLLSPATKQKLSLLATGKNNPFYGKKHSLTPKYLTPKYISSSGKQSSALL
jgi:hypothetical protein